jgi:hypothetical protein
MEIPSIRHYLVAYKRQDKEFDSHSVVCHSQSKYIG